ncbi:MAG: prephenate dehydrogenase/arogenate dehydrogenase family protein [Planctomycetes bacterium]|nr:prephenate dehydrogenase/arogenate dehydrogenase family protein [Planctomycetota bacterium]
MKRSSPRFKAVAIVGMGQIGGSLGMALLRRRLTRCVIGIDRDPAVLRRSKARRACTSTSRDLGAIAGADLVILAAPVRSIVSMAPAIRRALKPGALLTDVGSSKSSVMRAFRGVPGFVGGHPMCGTERGGIQAADPRLFDGATWVLVPADPAALPEIARLVRALGASPLTLDADDHDRAVALVSHLPYAFALALSASARKGLPARLAAGSFRSATRVAAQPAAMSLDILLSNRFHVARAAETMASSLRALGKALRKGDAAAVKRFQKAGQR